MARIRVLLADDHKILRLGLKAILASDANIEIVGEASDGLEAIQLARQQQPDVVVMDAQLPCLSGMEATRAIRQSLPHVQVMVLTMHDSRHLVLGMLRAGACSYLLKESTGTDIVEAIRATSQGRSILDPSVAGMVVDLAMDPHRTTADDEDLSPREHEIFELIGAGKTSREIAAHLSLSVRTVDNYRSHIFQKLRVRNRVEAINVGFQRGLLPALARAELGPFRVQ